MSSTSQSISPSKPDLIFTTQLSYRDAPKDESTPTSLGMKQFDKLSHSKVSRPVFARPVSFFKRLVTSFSTSEHLSTLDNPSKTPELLSHGTPNFLSIDEPLVDVPTGPKYSYRQNKPPSTPASVITQSTSNKFTSENLEKSQSITYSRKTNTNTLPALELTPLSRLIEQSYRDIRALRALHTAKSSNSSNTACNTLDMNLVCEVAQAEGKVIDLTKEEEKLKRFSELYAQFLRLNEIEGNPSEEIHLVAMVCKRSEVITGIREAPTNTLKSRVG